MGVTKNNHNDLSDLQQAVVHLKNRCQVNKAPEEILKLVAGLESMLEEHLQEHKKGPGITAQVSIYPLRQESLSAAVDDALRVFSAEGLETHPGSMSTLITGSDWAIWQALQNAFAAAATRGETVMIVTVSNACPWPFPDQQQH